MKTELREGYKVCEHCQRAKPIRTAFHRYPNGTYNVNCRKCHAKLHGFTPNRKRHVMTKSFKSMVHIQFGHSCHKCGSTMNLQIHHKTPVCLGGKGNDLNNVELLCEKCHRAVHAKGSSMSHESLAAKQIQNSTRRVPDEIVFSSKKCILAVDMR